MEVWLVVGWCGSGAGADGPWAAMAHSVFIAAIAAAICASAGAACFGFGFGFSFCCLLLTAVHFAFDFSIVSTLKCGFVVKFHFF